MINCIIFDWKRTLYDPDKKELVDGSKGLLEFIKSKNIPMVLIGKGGDDMHEEVKRLDAGKYFREMVFAEGEKDPKVFSIHISKDNPKSTFVIGDRVRSELEVGNKLGATTIWVKQGKFAYEEPENTLQNPTYKVSSLEECLSLLSSL